MSRTSPMTALARKPYPGDEVSCADIDARLRLPAAPGDLVVIDATRRRIGNCSECGQPVHLGNIALWGSEEAGCFRTCFCRERTAAYLRGLTTAVA